MLKSKSEAKKTKSRKSVADPALAIANPHAAGIDVHSREHWVCVPATSAPAKPKDHPANLAANVRAFGACTADLELLADWLDECGITTVAMESTGVYWIPLYDLLASQGFAVILVDPRQTKHAPGRPKSDVLDCQWIRRLHSYGLLTASFRPADEIVQWRGFQRQRDMLVRYAAQHVQHMQKALEEMNVKLTEVVCAARPEIVFTLLRWLVAALQQPGTTSSRSRATCARWQNPTPRTWSW